MRRWLGKDEIKRLRDALAGRTKHSARTVRETVEACIALAEEMAGRWRELAEDNPPFSPELERDEASENALRDYAARLKEAIGE